MHVPNCLMRFLMTTFLCLGLPAAELTASDEGESFFESNIHPVLVERCYECHSAKAEKIHGSLMLDTREGTRSGGDSGAAVIPGQPEHSLLLEAIRHEGLEMPPDSRLPDHVIADFEIWIQTGAADPRDGGHYVEKALDLEAGRRFWSFRPVKCPPIPADGDDWAITEIDRFVALKQVAAGLAANRDATPLQIVRRLYFGLIGLPPESGQLFRFLDQWANNPGHAVSITVDELLARPEFGERWGRHWLDIARFAESSGGGRSLLFPEAWRFRDYIIDSFNMDKPFDQLIREHIAGDLLPATSPAQRDEQITGTGYLVLGAINYELQDKELLRMEVIDEQIATIGRGFLGLTAGCARCHDHKFDPVPTADYYALAGILGSTQPLTDGNVSGFFTTPLENTPNAAAVREWRQRAEYLKQSIADLRKQRPSPENIRELQEQEKRHLKAKPPISVVMSVRDRTDPADERVRIRGGVRNLGPVVPRGFISVVDSTAFSNLADLTIPENQSGRRQLAEWLASPENPLTARVFVNRVWLHLIGEGLVRTPDNFGFAGQRPTHPKLLDYLAHRFSGEDHWSVKRLIRRIVTSRVYRLSSDVRKPLAAADPENRLLTHAFRRRLDAEALRDAMLKISGRLTSDRRRGPIFSDIGQYDSSYDHDRFSTQLRSVHVPAFRNARLEFFEVFDGANPNVVTGRRNRSTLPSQALYLLNSPFVADQAKWAARQFPAAGKGSSAATDDMIEEAFLTVIARPPTVSERIAVLNHLQTSGADSEESASGDAWTAVIHSLFASIDFRYLD